MRTLTKILWVVFSILLPVCSWAQQTGAKWRYHKSHITCTEEKQSTFNNALIFQNNTPITHSYLLISTPDEFSVFNLPTKFFVPSGDSVSIFLKFFSSAAKAPPQGKPVIIKFLMNGVDTVETLFFISQPLYRNLQIMSTMQSITYTKNQARLEIPVKIINHGNVEESITLQVTEGYFSKVPGSLPSFRLSSFSDTVVNLELKRNDIEFPAELLPLSIVAFDANSRVVSSVTLQSQLTGNTIDFDPRFVNSQENYIIAQAGGIGNGNRYNEFQVVWNRFGNSAGIIFSATYQQLLASRFLQLRDTYFGYKYKKWKLLAGSLFAFHQLQLLGQGIQVSYGTKLKNVAISYFFNSNPNTLSTSIAPLRDASNLLLTTNQLLKRNMNFSAFLLHQRNNKHEPDFIMGGGKISFRPNRQDSIETGFYINTYTEPFKEKVGFAGELNVFREKTGRSRYDFYNYASSSGFAGNFRKAVLLDESITFYSNKRLLKSFRLFSNYYRNTHEPFGVSASFKQFQSNFRAGASIELLIKKFRLSVSPYISYQELEYQGNHFTLAELKSSWSMFVQVSRSLSANASVDIALMQDRSVAMPGSKADKTLPVKMQGNILYKWIGWQVSMQNKPYYVFDLYRENILGQPLFYLVTGPSLNKGVFRNKLQFNGSYNFQLNQRDATPDHYINIFVQNNLSKKVSLTASFLYVDRSFGDFREFKIGLRYNLPHKINTGQRRKKLFLYEDLNQNQVKDPGERALRDIIFSANQSRLLRTGDDGQLTLIHYRPETDRIELINGQGYGFFKDIHNVSFDKRVNYVGMTRLGQVQGAITINKPRFSTKQPKLNGVSIVLTNQRGKEFLSYTDQKGVFQIFLPVGKYTVELDKTLTAYLKLKNPMSIEITTGLIERVSLEFDDLEAQPVEIKKFGNNH